VKIASSLAQESPSPPFVSLILLATFSFAAIPNNKMAGQAQRTQFFPSKTRVFIVSDISNEPDDAESLVRYLLYSNQFQTKGLVACTSTWMKTRTCPQDMRKIVDAYAKVVDNLNAHVHPDCPYASASSMASLIKTGPSVSSLLLSVICSFLGEYLGSLLHL